MNSKANIGARISLEGEKQYRQAIYDINKAQNVLKSELKAVSAEFTGNANSIDALNSKNTVLIKLQEEQEKRLHTLRGALESANKQYGEGSKQSQDWQIKLNNAYVDLTKLNNELDDSKRYLEEAKTNTNGLAKSINEYGKEVKEAGDNTLKTGDVIKANLTSTAIVGGVALLGGAVKNLASDTIGFAKDSTTAFNDLAAKTGAAGKELSGMKDTMYDIYADNFGQSIEDVATSMATVKQQTGLANNELKETTEQALLIRDTFDMDVNESIRSSKMIMDQFGLSSKDAFNLIAQGAQGGLDKNGDLLDSINEYSVHFKQLGLDADDMFNMLKNGSASGTFSVDKLGDAVKEFGIRVKDGSDTTNTAFKTLGLNTDQMAKSFSAGGQSANKALQTTITKLFEMKDPVKQNTIGVNLFGTMWEDLGASGIKALMNINGEMSSTKDALAQINSQKYTDIGSALDGLGRQLQTSIAEPLNNTVTPAINDFALKIKENAPEITETVGEMATVFSDGLGVIIENSELVIGGISGIATGMAVFKAGSAIQTGMDLAIKGWEGYKTATEGATIAQYALNTAQKLNPVGALAIAIGILTTAVIACSTHSKAATTDTERLNEKIKDTSEKSKELKEEIKKSNEEFANSAKEVKTNYGAIQVLSDKLYTLAEKENKTNSEKAKMKLLVNELNKSIPDLNLVMDEQTGIINKQKTETESLIESMKKKAIAQVYEARYLELANEQVKAQDNLTAAIDAQTEARNGYNEALKEQKELQDQQTRSDIDWDAVHKAQENVDKYKESLKNAKTEVKSANDTLEKCNDKFNKLDGQVETSTDSVKEFGNTMENAGDQTVKTNDKAQKAIKELTKTYNQAVKDRTKEIKSAMGLFDEFAIDTKVSGEKLMKNLKSQIDGMKDWAKNLQSLAKKGVSEGLLKELEDMGPEAASQIKALNKLSDKELKEYVAMWKEKSKLARKQAKEELSGLKEDTDKKINELTKSVESKLTTSGKNSAEGFTVGFLKQKIFMETSVGSALDDLVNSANKKLGIHSPSTVFAKMGYHSAEGYALGIKNGKNMIKKSLEEVGQEILSKAQQTLENYKVYHKMSLNEEVQYWDELRRELKKGTQARIDADKEYYDAKKAQTEAKKENLQQEKELLKQQKEAERDYKDNVKKIQDELVNNIEDANKRYTDAVESRTKSITGSMGLFNAFTPNKADGKELLNNLKGQVIGLNEWKSNLSSLKSKGVNGALLSELQEMGPGEAGEVSALNKLTSDELDQYVNLWKEKSKLAKEQAIDELSGLKDDTNKEIKELNKQANKSLKEYYNEYKTAMKELGVAIKDPVEKLKVSVTEDGKIIVQNVTNAMVSEMTSKDTINKLGIINNTITASLQDMVKKARIIGVTIAQGLAYGMGTQNSDLSLASIGIGTTIGAGIQTTIGTNIKSIEKEISPTRTNTNENLSVSQAQSKSNSNTKNDIQLTLQVENFNNYTSDDLQTISNELAFMTKRQINGGG